MEGSSSGPAQTQHLTPLVWIPLVPTRATAPRMLSCTEASSQDLQHLLGRKPCPVFLSSTLSSVPTSRLNAHLGAPSPNTSVTAAFQRQTEHLEILLVRSLPSPGGLSRGAQELLGTAPPAPPRHSHVQTQPRLELGVWARSPLSLPCRGAPDPCVTHGSQRFSLKVLQGGEALRQTEER